MKTCPQCAQECDDADNFCKQCGRSLLETTCPICHTAYAKGDEECEQCGYELAPVLNDRGFPRLGKEFEDVWGGNHYFIPTSTGVSHFGGACGFAVVEKDYWDANKCLSSKHDEEVDGLLDALGFVNARTNVWVSTHPVQDTHEEMKAHGFVLIERSLLGI